MKERCENCRFGNWRSGHIECRRNAPVVTNGQGRSYDPFRPMNAEWPLMQPFNWCGEFQLKTKPEDADDD